MATGAVSIVGDQVGVTEVPVDDSLSDILLGQGKGETAAGRFTQANAAGTVYCHLFREGILVISSVLEHDAVTGLEELLYEPFPYDPFALIQFLNAN